MTDDDSVKDANPARNRARSRARPSLTADKSPSAPTDAATDTPLEHGPPTARPATSRAHAPGARARGAKDEASGRAKRGERAGGAAGASGVGTRQRRSPRARPSTLPATTATSEEGAGHPPAVDSGAPETPRDTEINSGLALPLEESAEARSDETRIVAHLDRAPAEPGTHAPVVTDADTDAESEAGEEAEGEAESEAGEAVDGMADGEKDGESPGPTQEAASRSRGRRARDGGVYSNALGLLIERRFAERDSPVRSYSELERRSGISREALSRYVTPRADRRRSPTIDTLAAIAGALHLSIEQIARAAVAGARGVLPPDTVRNTRVEQLAPLAAALTGDQFNAVVELLRQMQPPLESPS